METSFIVPEPDGRGYAVLDQYGQLLRRSSGSGQELMRPAPAWWTEIYHAWKSYFEAVLDKDAFYDISFDVPEEGVTTQDHTKVYVDEMSSPHNGLWLRVQKAANGVAILTPLHYVSYLRVEVKRPNAFLVFHPTLLQDQLATYYGRQFGIAKGYVLPERFVGKIKAPVCPFCLEAMVASILVENLGSGGSEKVQRHLWLCRLCSPDSVMPAALVSSVARGLNNGTAHQHHLPASSDDSPGAGGHNADDRSNAG